LAELFEGRPMDNNLERCMLFQMAVWNCFPRLFFGDKLTREQEIAAQFL